MVVEEAIGDATLHDETLAELGLKDQPFIDNKKFNRFSDSTTQQVRADMEQHLRFGESIHLFTGDKGVGKTVFLSQLIKHCKSSINPFVAKGTEDFETIAFLAAVLNQLGGDEAESIADHVEALAPLFGALADEQKSVVLAIDDAHHAPIEEIAELIDIMGSFTQENGDKTARLLLTGEPRLKDELTAIAAEFEDDGFSFQHATTTLPPLDESRVGDYLTHQLNQAGFTDVFPFTDKAIGKIYRESSGIPTQVNAMGARYLNTVYSGAAAPAGGKGLFAALGWPLVALGAAAMGLIAWGLSMFVGNDPQTTTVVAVDEPAVTIESSSSANADSTNESALQTNDTALVVSADSGDAQPTVPVITAEPNTVQSSDIITVPTETVAQPDDTLLKPADRLVVEAETTTPIVQTTPQEDTTEAIAQPEPPTVDTDAVAENAEELVVTSLPSTNPAVETVTAATPEPLVDEVEGVETVIAEVPDSVLVDVPNSGAESANEPQTQSTGTDASAIPELDTSGIAVAIDELSATSINSVRTAQPNTSAAASSNTAEDNSAGVAVAVEEPTIITRAIENERWVLFQAPTKFTVQLATSRERDYIIDLAQSLDTDEPIAIYPFLTTNSNNPVFGLLSGLYETRSEAIAAVENMASETKQFGVWIRPIADLQSDIKKRR